MSQGTPEWKAARLSHVTASRFADVLTEPRSKAAKEAGELSQTAESYLLELIGESLTGLPNSELETFAMKWGHEQEPKAREQYIWRTGRVVEETGFVLDADHELVGGSPDGLIGTDGAIEIKCPLNTANHIRVLLSGQMPDEHMPQVQGLLWITGCDWCDFVSFDPRLKTDATQLVVVRVERDESYIADLAERVLRFRDKLVTTLAQIASRETSHA